MDEWLACSEDLDSTRKMNCSGFAIVSLTVVIYLQILNSQSNEKDREKVLTHSSTSSRRRKDKLNDEERKVQILI